MSFFLPWKVFFFYQNNVTFERFKNLGQLTLNNQWRTRVVDKNNSSLTAWSWTFSCVLHQSSARACQVILLQVTGWGPGFCDADETLVQRWCQIHNSQVITRAKPKSEEGKTRVLVFETHSVRRLLLTKMGSFITLRQQGNKTLSWICVRNQ